MAELLFDVSAFDCAILRAAFIKSVMEDNVPEKRWRALAAVEPGLLGWITRK
ncbi:hypothetical protein [Mesorhizobium sp. M0619]|uniref:hypothetical protein n=1 Tax=unclassified Mesorhizobium TaxID=325217 RepID=UPI00333BB20E